MAHFEKIFKFCQLPNKKFSAYDAKSVQDLLLKWGLKGNMSLDVFSYDAFFKDCDKDKFVMDFFKDQDVQAFFKISPRAKVWTFDGDLKSVRLQVEVVPATVVNMEFFDKIFLDGLVRESGSICKCYDDQIGDILVSDELRKHHNAH
ncbi:cilia- and flagella-associated protein 300-like isoform X2 [Rhopilema esculentum]|uniref:cilia- and flagella-associated protein 300-like isoform X2 n=1 Tax=Rhopilema esculentum TaxID=499914 RepID=UPI0031DEBA59